ncbi:hypothetical protein FQN55_000186 [Onygenales sp. PD_40]|nr:hypothetical protein FQN55_000186 [Onygenales sp. PD_40]
MEDSKSRLAAAASSPMTPREIRALRRRGESPLPAKLEEEDESTPSTIPTTPSFIFSPHSRTGSNGANTEGRNGTQTQQTWMGNTSTDHTPSKSSMFEDSGIFVTPETGVRNMKTPMQQATTMNTDTPPKRDTFNFSLLSPMQNDRLDSPRGGLKQDIGSGVGTNGAAFGKMDDGISVPRKTQERQAQKSLFEPREKYPTDDDEDGTQWKIKEIWEGSTKPLAEPQQKENSDGLSSPPLMFRGSFGTPLGTDRVVFGKEKNEDGLNSPPSMFRGTSGTPLGTQEAGFGGGKNEDGLNSPPQMFKGFGTPLRTEQVVFGKDKNEDGLSSPPSIFRGSFGPPLGTQGAGFGKEKHEDGFSPQQMDLAAQVKALEAQLKAGQAQMAALMAQLVKAQLGPANDEQPRPTKGKTEATDTGLEDDDFHLSPPESDQDRSRSPPLPPKTNDPLSTSFEEIKTTPDRDSESDDSQEEDETEVDNTITEGDGNLSALIPRGPSSGPVDVIWDWDIPDSRKEAIQPFFQVAGAVGKILTKQEEKKGFIYAFEVLDPQGRGRVKVGTTSNLKKRMNEHEECYGECVQLYPPKNAGKITDKVKHSYRVEAIIHAELLSWAVCVKQCPRGAMRKHVKHGEWFELGKDHVLAVVKKWVAWCNCNGSPYEEVPNPLFGNAKGKKSIPEKIWKLKPLSIETISQLCTPILPNSWKRIGDVGSKNSE